MEITFKISESMDEILNSIYNGVFYESIVNGEKSPGGWDVVLLQDRDHQCYATAYVHPDRDTVQISTFWSRFTYLIYSSRGQVYVKFNGAYNGLLAQNLLPKLTPVDLENEMVHTSLKGGNLTYKEYAILQDKFQQFKSTL